MAGISAPRALNSTAYPDNGGQVRTTADSGFLGTFGSVLPPILPDVQPTPRYLSVSQLARQLGLPVSWLRDQAREGHLPCLRVGRRLMFDVRAVQAVLEARAQEQPVKEDQR